jgi:hypothetical protein
MTIKKEKEKIKEIRQNSPPPPKSLHEDFNKEVQILKGNVILILSRD